MNYYTFLTIFLANLLILGAIPSLVKFLLFCKLHSFLGIKLFFTPGIVIRKEEWLNNKINNAIIEYQKFCLDKESQSIIKAEKKLNDIIYEKTKFILSIHFLPTFVCKFLHKFIGKMVYLLTTQSVKEITPRLVSKYEIESHLLEIRNKISPEFVEEISQKYLFRYLTYFFVALGLFTGIINLLIIWIL